MARMRPRITNCSSTEVVQGRFAFNLGMRALHLSLQGRRISLCRQRHMLSLQGVQLLTLHLGSVKHTVNVNVSHLEHTSIACATNVIT